MFYQDDDYLTAELNSVTDHRYLTGVLELQVEYSDGEISPPVM